ncbi:chemotaxis protein CheB [Oculatella sp. FACHB-28]|uniref:chemotaxis protein CheB n=1 Tax=Oculatella sp. FACHB-28 TaxID=2692845 RepID=UPI001689C7B6|nr:chemotaxis protein CheB [Oculatella sp. FACHB-28]
MSKHSIVVVGTSAGGMEALKQLVAHLPSNLPTAIFIVWHVAPESTNILPQILERVSPLPVAQAINNETIQPGRIYVAPSDHHLLVELGQVRVTKGPKENRFRPSVDVLFRSAALAYGSQVIGVVLTGLLNDGASGLYAVKERGGRAVVQDPVDALHPSMPIQAMKAVPVDYCVPIKEMGALLGRLSNEVDQEKEEMPVSEQMKLEVAIAGEDNAFRSGIMKLGQLSPYTCPECHGVLLQLKDGGLVRFRCHTGHAYSLNALLTEVTESIEASLWSTLRGIEESELLMNYLAEHLYEANDSGPAELLRQKLQEASKRAELVRQAIRSNETLSEEKLTSDGASLHK